MRFIIRTDLKIMPGIFKNENLMVENSSRILKWFKFLLHHEGGRYTRLEHTVFTSQKYIKKDAQGQRIDSKIYTRQIPLNFRV